LGSNALSSSSSLKQIEKYVRHHHERWDGNGYPDGLSENNIPLVSQILCAADAWDAMRSKRTYRDSLSHEQAISEIKKNKGSQFAPKIVESMLEIIEK
jgi:HD-GYP domain-containing protein (c-di-GMP phosphodiesterase class II)